MAEIRIGDEERQLAIDRLNVAYGEGRLELTELEDRLDTVNKAKFPAELNAVVEDLPGGVAVPEGPPIELDAHPAETSTSRFAIENFNKEYGFFIVPPLVCTAIYAMTTFGQYFWPMWVWFGCACVVLIGLFDDDE